MELLNIFYLHIFCFRPYDAKNPFLASVLVNRELHEGGVRSCLHMEFDITGSKIRWDKFFGCHLMVLYFNYMTIKMNKACILSQHLITNKTHNSNYYITHNLSFVITWGEIHLTVFEIQILFPQKLATVPQISAYTLWNCQVTKRRLQIEITIYPDSLLYISAGFLPRISSQQQNWSSSLPPDLPRLLLLQMSGNIHHKPVPATK